MFDGGYRASVGENGEVQVMARSLGLEAAPHEIRRREDIAPLFDVLKGQADALYVVENALTVATAALPRSVMNSRRLIASSKAQDRAFYGFDLARVS
jgi:hypothetical protein